jgi:hypothetical protein
MSKDRHVGTVRFSAAELNEHIDRYHPLCPAHVRRKIVRRIVARTCTAVPIGSAFGIISGNLVRHEMTDYNHLLYKRGLERQRARQLVASEVRDIIRSWSDPTKLIADDGGAEQAFGLAARQLPSDPNKVPISKPCEC